jgi:hypothetical protein
VAHRWFGFGVCQRGAAIALNIGTTYEAPSKTALPDR